MTALDMPAPNFVPAIEEQVDALTPTSYDEAAFKGEFDLEPAKHNAVWASDLFENGTRCHEYLVLSLEPQVGELEDWKKLYNEPMTQGEAAYQQRRARVEGTTLPAGMHYCGFIFSLENMVVLVRYIALLGTFIGVICLFLGFLIFGSVWYHDIVENYWLFLAAYSPFPLTWVLFGKLVESGWAARYSRAARPYISFRRDLGEVHIRSWRKIHKIPFAELQAGAVTTFDVQTKLKKLAFGVKHKHSKLSVAMEGSLTATTPAGRWALCVRWELLQHYMDTTRPLPDIPMLEPYRHLDPTTRAWDEKHQRPRWVWMTMSDEDYSQLRSAALKAAETYPFSAPGHEPDPGDRERWQPAGDGNHWYQLG